MTGFGGLSELPLSTLPTQQSLAVIEPAVLVAEGGHDRVVPLSWSSSVVFPFLVNFVLVRRDDRSPLTIDDGDVVYTGQGLSFDDTQVVNHQRYWYTVFTVYRIAVDNEIVPYAEVSSADAVPRLIVVNRRKAEEYVPKRGEFGVEVAYPVRSAPASFVWGDIGGDGRQDRDLIVASPSTPAHAPVTGRADVYGDVIVVTSAVGGFRFTMTGVGASVVSGARVRAGEVIGRLTGRQLRFTVTKLAAGRFGDRTVRPTYFYLTLEARDGRR